MLFLLISSFLFYLQTKSLIRYERMHQPNAFSVRTTVPKMIMAKNFNVMRIL